MRSFASNVQRDSMRLGGGQNLGQNAVETGLRDAAHTNVVTSLCDITTFLLAD